ncbi:MAG TPA: thymidine phosphorylase [Armatimonadota bacterium]|jgi:pyrimidine-nucleoside phosphorylase
MNLLPLIEAKRDGRALAPEDLRDMIVAWTARELPDYQMAAFLMAVYFQGLNPAETAALTLAMRDSGDVLSFPKDDPRPVVDKHSTGGVGDKVSLPLAPLLACLGFRVPMISGRGLGITGGTLDKLDAIPGYRSLLEPERLVELVQRVGCVICGQTERLAPADRGMYALRDVTGAVPSIPLITASILSKKLAEGLQALLLDVKFGSAASIPEMPRSQELAAAMTALGRECGISVRALLTDMDTPLGRSAGNLIEVKESVECLDGGGPEDLRSLTIECAAHLMLQTGRSHSLDAARAEALLCLASGAPRRKWDEMLVAQGARLDELDALLARDSTAAVVRELSAGASGYIARCDARIVGEIVRDLGGGRQTKDAVIVPSVGVDRLMKPGEPVAAGSVLARVHAANEAGAERALRRLSSAYAITDAPPSLAPLVREVVCA